MSASPTCERGCQSWAQCDEPGPHCSAMNSRKGSGERFGAGVCVTGRCVEPCGDDGGCKR